MKPRESIERNPAIQRLELVDVAKIVAEYYQVTICFLKKATRKADVVKLRQIASYLAWKYTKASLGSIGEYFGKFDHTTVMHSRSCVIDKCARDYSYKVELDDLEEKCMKQVDIYDHMFINQAFINQVISMTPVQKAKLEMITLKQLKRGDEELINKLQESDLSLVLAQFYHDEFSLSQFERAIELPYEKSAFKLYALKHYFNGEHRTVTADRVKHTKDTGKRLCECYHQSLLFAHQYLQNH